jgi:2-dehydropantoate 2-reductase
MKIAVVGAGAIGSLIGACLARGGTETHLLARGPHLAAMRRDGVRVVDDGQTWSVRVPCTEDPREIGPVDCVILGLKAYAYGDAGQLLGPLMRAETSVVPAQNGIPWWYFYAHGGPYDGRRIESVDPGGAVSAAIPAERVIGCVVYPAAILEAPGVVRHIEGRRLPIGEPSGAITERARALSQAMAAGGLRCPVEERLREQIWVKLMGNAALNPLSALTGATLAEICRFEPTRALATRMMEEVLAVANSLGCEVPVSIERRLAGAERVGDHRTSMLQDLEAGKRLELEALLGAVVELAELTGVDVPALRDVYATVSLLAAVRSGAGSGLEAIAIGGATPAHTG